MALTTARKKANAKYEAKAYDKTLIRLPKGRLNEIRAHIEPAGESLNGFIGRAISETMAHDSGGTPPEIAGKLAESAQGAGVVSLPSEAFKAAQEAAEVGDMPFPVDKAQTTGELLTILGDLGTVDLERDKCERLGIVYLPPDTLRAAQQAAEATGEAPVVFITRAIETQVKRDKTSLAMGINPTTGGKQEKEA